MMLQGSLAAGKGSFWDWIDRGQALAGTKYVSGKNREDYRAIFSEGLIIHPEIFAQRDSCELIFVIDEWGRIYISTKTDAEDVKKFNFNHASFLSGNPVASAGKMVVSRGKIVEIEDQSGHYRPSVMQMKIALQVLSENGVDIDSILVKMRTGKRRWKSGTDFWDWADKLYTH
jgi:hypothetical protein